MLDKGKVSRILSDREQKYIQNLPKTRSKKEAAKLAGYPDSTAGNPNQIEKRISTKVGADEFKKYFAQRFPAEKLGDKLDQLLECQKNGKLGLEDDNATQLRAVQVIARFAGLVDSIEPDEPTAGATNVQININLKGGG